MCVILPVNHIPCTHTVAIWQHCIDAPRSKAYGLEPCRKIRQCSRPIITRKKCINCGGPRFFARRGGIAERGISTPWMLQQREEQERDEKQWMDANDSGYHSDAIPEEDEPQDNDDFAISPSAVPRRPFRSTKRRESIDEMISPRSSVRDLRQQRNLNRKPSWRPNLKRELTKEQELFPQRESVSSEASSYIEDTIGRAKHSHWPSLDVTARSTPPTSNPSTPPRRPALPPIDTAAAQRRPPPMRKISSLLHPSSPPMQITMRAFDVSPVSPTFPTTSTTSLPIRKSSTLLHPSSPSTTHAPMNTTQSEPILPTMSTLPRRPPMPRKTSTLLHPSSPPDERPTIAPKAYSRRSPTPPMSSHSYHSSDSSVSSLSSTSSKASTPNFSSQTSTPNFSLKGAKQRISVLHSALSDTDSASEYSEDEEDVQAHGKHGDVCFDDDDGVDEESEGEVVVVEAIVATAARIARASRIEFQGAHWRSVSSVSTTA